MVARKQDAVVAEEEAYCVKCKSKGSMKDVVDKQTANGRHMRQGKCVKCGTTMSKFVSGKKE